MVLPCEGHLDAIFHIFAYLKNKHNSWMIFDPTYVTIDMTAFQEYDWKSFYGNIKEPIPLDMLEPWGKDVDLHLYIDSDHAGDKHVQQYWAGYFIYLNLALVSWKLKKQATIENSVFRVEFVVMKQGTESMRGLESTLKKKSNSICYHAMRESMAMNESLTRHISTNGNPADLATKVINGGQKRNHLVSKLLYHIYDEDWNN